MPIYRAWGEYGCNLGTLRAKDDPTAVERAKKKWPVHHKAGDIHLFNDALGYTFNLRREAHLPPHNPLVVPYNRNMEELEEYWRDHFVKVIRSMLKAHAVPTDEGEHVIITFSDSCFNGKEYPVAEFTCTREGIEAAKELARLLKKE